MFAADSNILLRLLVGDVPQQSEEALRWLEKQSSESVLVVDAVLVEVLFLLESTRAYGIKREHFTPQLMALLRSDPWKLSDKSWQALERFSFSKLDYTDCLLASLQDIGIVRGVITFDKALAKQTGHVPDFRIKT